MQMNQQIWVITGTSKGIGNALVSRVLKETNGIVYACARSPAESPSLQELKSEFGSRLHLLQVDLDQPQAIQAAAEHVKATETKVDVLVNNAGISEPMTIGNHDLKSKEFIAAYETNVIGPHCMIQAFSALLKASDVKKIINISSAGGSMGVWTTVVHNPESPLQPMAPYQAAYRASKAALNSLTLSWALTLRPEEGYKIIALDPGSVSTETARNLFRGIGQDLDMLSSMFKILTAEESARDIISIIDKLEVTDSGKFINSDGKEMPF